MSDEEYEKLKQYMADQIKEIELYKWLESEKANRDLGEEAVKDWIEKHAAEFRERWEKANGKLEEDECQTKNTKN